MLDRRHLLLIALVHNGLLAQTQPKSASSFGQLMAGQWRCMLDDLTSGRTLARIFSWTQPEQSCYPDVTVHLYSGWPARRKVLDPRRPAWLRWSGWDPRRRTVILVHGFNGGHQKAPITSLRDAYLRLGGYNVLVVDWEPLARYPCYSDAVRGSRQAARCSAQVLAALQATLIGTGAERPVSAAPADARLATCVGHSLGAHICGMLSRLMPSRLYKVVALDPARPRIESLLGNDRLDAGDARVVHSLHTNMGFYGEYPTVGHASFCLNGGRLQPQCSEGSAFSRYRCSHFLSVCLFAQQLEQPLGVIAVPCDRLCRRVSPGPPFTLRLAGSSADRARGTFCVATSLDSPCRIDL